MLGLCDHTPLTSRAHCKIFGNLNGPNKPFTINLSISRSNVHVNVVINPIDVKTLWMQDVLDMDFREPNRNLIRPNVCFDSSKDLSLELTYSLQNDGALKLLNRLKMVKLHNAEWRLFFLETRQIGRNSIQRKDQRYTQSQLL